MSGAPTVHLVISSFRHDAGVERVLRRVHDGPVSVFDKCIVVDSQGTGAIPALIDERGWDDVIYRSAEENLGSAGNLAERLRLAARLGGDFAYAVNHDGDVDLNVVLALLAEAQRTPDVGAVYPLRYLPSREQYDLTGTRRLPLPFHGSVAVPASPVIDVHWSSSNGALYSMHPVRKGILPWADLWMGWEDMAYGWALEESGYRQLVVTGARTEDNYEYRAHAVGARALHVTDKPAWYTYYGARNLVLLLRRPWRPAALPAVVALRILVEAAVIMLLRPHKLLRYRLLGHGVLDGLRNRAGRRQLRCGTLP